MADYSRWHNDISQTFMSRGYLGEGQTIEDRINVIALSAEKILNKPGFAAKFISYMEKGWYSLSTPVWSNFGTNRGLGISCFNSHIEDDMSSILFTQAEVGMMSKYGGGTSAYFGDLRPRGAEIRNNGNSSGAVHFMKLFDSVTNVVSQGSQRRGSFAAYLPIEHPDIEEFLDIRKEGAPIQDLSFGVCVPEGWIKSMKAGDAQKRSVWAKVLQRRGEVGYPYIFFTDNANEGTVGVYKDKGMKINSSNLCSEIFLPSKEDESFVCNLSSMNILYYDEWKGTDAVQTLVYFLDAVMSEFIDKAKKIPFMDRAARFAENHRALGIGWIGWHSYLQSRMIPFESMQAKMLTAEISKYMKEEAYKASETMASEYGEPPVLKGYGRRNTTLLAIAPTTSSAFILGQVSQSIEPWNSNYFIKDVAKVKFSIKNSFLQKLLKSKNKDTKATWDSILKAGGSVQHLDFLSKEEKDVFKTFAEISQKEIIVQASIRQKHIDQGQSLNLMIHPKTPAKEVNALILSAHELGVKSLYYQHSFNAAQEFTRELISCVSCE